MELCFKHSSYFLIQEMDDCLVLLIMYYAVLSGSAIYQLNKHEYHDYYD